MTVTVSYGNFGASLAHAATLGLSGLYLGLHTSSPLVASPGPTEVLGGDYIRKAVSFVISGHNAANLSSAAWSAMPAALVKFIAVWDNIATYNLVAMWDISATPVSVPLDGSFFIAKGELSSTL